MSNANKILLNGNTLIDLTQDTAIESDVAVGKTFHKADGSIATGTAEYKCYDGQTGTIHEIYLKPRIERPTTEQMNFFVNEEIAHFTHDVELIEGDAFLTYNTIPIAEGVSITLLFIRWGNSNFQAYYVWEEDVDVAKLALGATGMDVSGVTGEGWQLLETGTTIRTLTEEELLYYNLDLVYDYAIPYGDYFYSLFNFYVATFPSTIRKPANVISDYALVTEDKLCESDILVAHNGYSLVSKTDKYGTSVDMEGDIKEYNKILYVDIDMISNEASRSIDIYTFAFDHFGAVKECGYAYRPIGKTSLELSRNTFGILITHNDGITFNVYTNATIIEQNNSEIYISGLRHDTHIVLIEE